MARRINSNFIITLSIALTVAVAGIVVVLYVRRMRERDPEVVRARAVEAEKSGNIRVAAEQFARAGTLAAQKHMPGADTLFAHGADLFMQLSKDATTQEDAVRFYQAAKQLRTSAQTENPRNQEVNAALLEDNYGDAQLFPSLSQWKTLEDVATKAIKTQDALKPRLYRAEARLRQYQLTPKPSVNATKDIEDDLAAAFKFDPKSGKAYALKAEMTWVQARQSAMRRGLSTVEDFQKDAKAFEEGKTETGQYAREMAGVRKMLQDYLDSNGMNADVAAALANMSLEQYSLAADKNQKLVDEAISLLEQASALDPHNANLLERLGALYMANQHPEKTEALYKQVIARDAAQPDAYFRLAVYYQDQGDFDKAIATFKDVLKHPLVGIGREAIVNENLQIASMELVAWLSMEMADQDIAQEKKKAFLKEAADMIDRMRTSHAPKGVIDLLDGRMQFVNGDLAQAVDTLRRAEGALSATPQSAEWYRRTEIVLAKVNERKNQWGLALELLDKAMEIRADYRVVLEKGAVLVQLKRNEDARKLMMMYLGKPSADGATYSNEARLPKPFVESAKRIVNYTAAMEGNLAGLRSSGELITLALTDMAAEDYVSAATDAAQAIEQATGNEPGLPRAYETAIVANIQLKRKDEAKKFVALALAKYPGNAGFQVLKAQLDLPGDADTPEAQRTIIGAITDEYQKQMSFAAFYHRQKQWDDEIKAATAAAVLVENPTGIDDREQLHSAVEQLFGAALNAAAASKDPAVKEGYWRTAQTCVTRAEKFNLDGAAGLLYRGRLELERSNGESGLQYLQQAVAAHPDDASCRFMLGQAYLKIAQVRGANPLTAAQVNTNQNSALEQFREVVRLSPGNLRGLQLAITLLINKGDTSSLKEAQDMVATGIRMAPRNPYFLAQSELFSSDVTDAIKRRAELLKSNPDDLNNRLRLAALYVRQKNNEVAPEKKLAALNSAIALVDWAYQKNKDDLTIADRLARLLVEEDRSDKGTGKAIQIYNSFLTNPDKTVQFSALLAKGDFLRKLRITSDAYATLRSSGLMEAEGPKDIPPLMAPVDEAAATFAKAIAVEPAGVDMAERQLADLNFDRGSFAEAEKLYAQIMDKNTDANIRDRVERRLVESELRQDSEAKVKDAIARLDAEMKRIPKDAQLLTLRAFSSIRLTGVQKSATPSERRASLQTAMDFLNRAIDLDANNADAFYYRAMTKLQLGEKADEAIRDLLAASKSDRTSSNARVLLADVYRRSQRYEEAAVIYEELLRDRPELLDVRIAYAEFLRSLTDLKRTLPVDSREDFVVSILRLDPETRLESLVRASAQMYPTQPRWPFFYAQLLLLQKKTEQAERVFQALYDYEKNANTVDAQVVDAYVDALNQNQNYTRAIEMVSPILDSNAEFIAKTPQWAVLYLRRAEGNRGLNKQAEIVPDVDKALAVAVTGATRDQNLGPFITVLGEASRIMAPKEGGTSDPLKGASAVADRLRVRLAANPSETISKIGLMQMLLMMKQPDEAMKVAQSINPSNEIEALRPLVLRQVALVNYQAKRYADADKYFNELFAMNPKDVESLNNYAYMLTDAMNQPAKGLEVANRALAILSNESYEAQVLAASANVYDTLGWSKFRNGDTDGAILSLQHAISAQPVSEAYYHLALAYEKKRAIPEAQNACDEGIKFATARKDEVLQDLKKLRDRLK